MNKIYGWVPWFQELVTKISQEENSYLIANAKKVNWLNEYPALLRFGDANIDPFSFIYTLASQNKHPNRRRSIYSSVAEIFELEQFLNFDDEECFYFPTPPGVNTLFHHDGVGNSDLLWSLFRSSVNGIDTIEPELFENSLKIGRVGIKKLTQALFLANPTDFLPIDDQTKVLDQFPSNQSELSWKDYEDNIQRARNALPGCELFEVNLLCYLISTGKLKIKDHYFQVSTNVYKGQAELWDEFKSTSSVFTAKDYPSLKEPSRGDIILVRYSNLGKGIGIVYRNEYSDSGGYAENRRIQVLWLNKSSSSALSDTNFPGTHGFTVAKSIKGYFQETKEYKATFELLSKLGSHVATKNEEFPNSRIKQKHRNRPINSQSLHRLNLIFYGPPGTGKTYSTRKQCIEFCDGVAEDMNDGELRERFRELCDVEERVEFITFHQSYGYEEFIEGLRPVAGKSSSETSPCHSESSESAPLGTTSGGFSLKVVDGVLKRIAKRARNDEYGKPHVLVIDEINRANISKVFGELVTLLEEDKREGGENEVEVTLPYSGEPFTLPPNLFILGTMNTADRSIALLDTALRRRFEFKEMPPDLSTLVTVEGIDLKAVLGAINNRLEYLSDRDHLIGHAWLMKCRSKEEIDGVMRSKIIPLLAEYFYDDWNKVRSVLGGGNHFIVREPLTPPPGMEDYSGEDRYRWFVREDEFDVKAYENLVKPTLAKEADE